MKAIISNINFIGGMLLALCGFYGFFWSAAAGDTFGIIAIFAFLVSMLVFVGGMALIERAEKRSEKLAVAFFKFQDSITEDAE